RNQMPERSMRFDKAHSMSVDSGDLIKCANLVGDEVHQLVLTERNVAAAKAPKVGVSRMRTNGDALLLGCTADRTHDARVPGMEATGEVGAGYHLKHRVVIGATIGTKTLAHVAIEIDRPVHR